ncbi:MAG TPA: prolyl oligopeptidase family serine peptidase [Puia sp.]|jgi:dipeptidyl aminopeptidase/acylaminoacyl peptidase|nr:prolyl oligopeptidase family serine peptidase [Puia sp.]
MRKAVLLFLLPFSLAAQAQPTSFLNFKKYPYPTELTAAPAGERIAWAMDEEGRRNIYVAEGPDYAPRKLTDYSTDDAQEITGLSISADGQWVVFVRGGDHGSNWDGGLPVDPLSDIQPFKMQVASIPWAGGAVRYLSEGDAPAISPDGKQVAFIKNGQVWIAPADGSAAAGNLFTTRGAVSGLQWSPDGKRLLFVTARTDHAIIGIYTAGSPSLKWMGATFAWDASPKWSGDGSRIVFVRRAGVGGAPDSLTVNRPVPWSIYVADTASGQAVLLWKSSNTLRGSYPSTDGGANLHWAKGNTIVFLSYQDGWPHLYSLDAGGGGGDGGGAPAKPLLLTPGNFMCEHIRLSADGRYLVCSANTGDDAYDIERRHVLMVSVDKPDMHVMTPGKGLEWTPVITGDGKTLAFLSATVQRPPLPAVMGLGTGAAPGVNILCADHIPADFPLQKLIEPRQVIFTSADGVIVHADLFLPPGGAARKPAIVYLHGGPPREMLLGWHYSAYYSNAYASNQYLASLGFVVLAVNYRLGIGYGYEFNHPPHAGAMGASEYLDVRSAGLWLRKQNFVDTARIGVYGGSYGGFLTALALGKDSKLFAAGVDFHGVHDWLNQSSLITAFRDRYEKAPDYDKALKTAWLSSPDAYVGGWTSPVLIIQGDDDRNVRVGHSIDLVNRLAKKGVPYEAMMIVDDTHEWMKFSNAVKVYGAAADFFVRKFLK